MSQINQNIEINKKIAFTSLLESYLDLLLDIEILNQRVSPIIEEIFYSKLGSLQFEVKSLELDVFRNKRRIDLINAEISKNHTPDFNIIEKKIETEFLVWKTNVAKLGRQLKMSISDRTPHLDDDELTILNSKMRKIISKIHPSISDTNIDDLQLLYENALKYYKFNNIAGLEIICDEIYDIQAINEINYLENNVDFNLEYDKIENLLQSKTIEKEKLMTSFPLGFIDLINDNDWIQKRKIELRKIKAELLSQNNLLLQVLNFIKYDLNYGQFSPN